MPTGARAARRNGARLLPLVAVVAAALVAAGWFLASRSAGSVVWAEPTSFTPASLTASSGTVKLEIVNDDLQWHTFTIEELGVDVRLPVRTSRSLTFEAAEGTYEYVCTIPGHARAGMVGVLRVR